MFNNWEDITVKVSMLSKALWVGSAMVATASVHAGTVPAAPSTTLPVDSPFAIGALAVAVLVIGYRLLRKK